MNTTPLSMNPSKETHSPAPGRPVSNESSKTQPMSKRKVKDPNKEDLLGTTIIGPSKKSSYKPDSQAKTPAPISQDISREEQLEQKISSILTTIPAQIHLTSEDEAGVNESSRQTKSETPSAPRLYKTPTPSSNSYTLAPAKPQTSKVAAIETDNPEVKLYHLRRGGVEASTHPPIKLFVRLVGSENNERVMVRVGGGWSELGDYLRDYAIHHNTNRRSILNGGGDGLMDVKQLPMSAITSTSTPSSTSRQYNVSRDKEIAGGMTPGSSNYNNNNSSKFGGGQRSSRRSVSSSTPVTPITLTPNTLLNNHNNNTATPTSTTTTTTTNRPRPRPDRTSTADSDNGPKSSFTPAPLSIADGIARSSSTRNSGKSPRPLSTSFNNRLSAEKQAWVEAMIGRVKRTTTSHTTAMTTISNPSTPVTIVKTNKNAITSSTPTDLKHTKNISAAITPISTTYMDATISSANKNITIDPSTNPSSRTPSREEPSTPSPTTTDPSSNPNLPPESSTTSKPNSNSIIDLDMDILTFGDLGTVGRGSGVGVGFGAQAGEGGGGGRTRRVYPKRQPSSS